MTFAKRRALQMETAAEDIDFGYYKAVQKFLQARQLPGQSPGAFYKYVRRLETKLEDLPACFLSSLFFVGLLPELQKGLAIRGVDSLCTRDEIVKQAGSLWALMSLTATAMGAEALTVAASNAAVERSHRKPTPAPLQLRAVR